MRFTTDLSGGMSGTQGANKDNLFLYHMASLSIGSTRIYQMTAIKTAADAVPFDHLIAHSGKYLKEKYYTLFLRVPLNEGIGILWGS
jgi:hypothetical protein